MPKKKKKLSPTPQQQAILDAFMDARPMVVQALAGTGKTTTLQMLAEETDDIGLYIAFNRYVANEAKKRFPDTVDTMTAHALAKRTLEKDPHWSAVMRSKFSARDSSSTKAFYDKVIYPIYPHDGDNYFKLNEALQIATGIQGRPYLYYSNWSQLVMATVKRYCQSADDEIGAEHFSASTAAYSINRHGARDVAKKLQASPKIVERTVELARAYWERALDPYDRAVKFGFDHVLKVWQLSKPVLDYDYVMFDEAQDANATLSHVLLEQPQHGTQIIVVGDQNQAIYGFTGALDAMTKFAAQVPGALVLPLSESWRFGAPVADAANAVLRMKGSTEEVTGLGEKTEPLVESYSPVDYLAEGVDAVLCRSNQGCLDVAIGVLKDHPRAKLHMSVKLDEMQEFFNAALNFQRSGKTKYPVMKDYPTYAEFEAAVESDSDMKAEFGLLLAIARRAGGMYQAKELIQRIEDGRTDPDTADVTISTVHQAKGSEWDSVALHGDWTGGLNTAEEKNLLYVAATRAKRRLHTGGFWPVFRHSIPMVQDQLAELLRKIADEEKIEGYKLPSLSGTATTLVAVDGPPLPDGRAAGRLEFDATLNPKGQAWVGVSEEDIVELRVSGIGANYRGAFLPYYEEIVLDRSVLEKPREQVVAQFTEPAENALAHMVMDARDAMAASELPDGMSALGCAVSMLKAMFKDGSGKAAAEVERASGGFDTPEQARSAVCAALLDHVNHPAAAAAVEDREDFAGAKARRFARA